MRKAMLIVAIVLSIGVGIGIGYALWGDTQYVFPPPPNINNEEPPQTILADSFILSVHKEKYMSEQELQEYAAWLEENESHTDEYWYWDISFPFNRFGMYLNRFFLQKGEAVEVIMQSPEQLGIVDVGKSLTSFVPLSFLIEIGPGALTPSYAPSSTLNRVNSNWELRFTFKAESDGYYFFTIYNGMPDQIWCQYAVILKS